mmetsp:Transcript_20494/g.63758  ORF Transcript_20494/g.63758 Transcript_20494/m.63758 type:complete len:217 (+) Transcript_20494:89-739(+)
MKENSGSSQLRLVKRHVEHRENAHSPCSTSGSCFTRVVASPGSTFTRGFCFSFAFDDFLLPLVAGFSFAALCFFVSFGALRRSPCASASTMPALKVGCSAATATGGSPCAAIPSATERGRSRSTDRRYARTATSPSPSAARRKSAASVAPARVALQKVVMSADVTVNSGGAQVVSSGSRRPRACHRLDAFSASPSWRRTATEATATLVHPVSLMKR